MLVGSGLRAQKGEHTAIPVCMMVGEGSEETNLEGGLSATSSPATMVLGASLN